MRQVDGGCRWRGGIVVAVVVIVTIALDTAVGGCRRGGGDGDGSGGECAKGEEQKQHSHVEEAKMYGRPW